MNDDEPASTGIVPYAVGYGKPPVERRFTPGVSGNPSGRPRGSKSAPSSNLDPRHANALLLEEAYRPVALRDGDGVIELPAIQAVFRAMNVAAMKGNRFFQKTLAELVGKLEAEQTEALITNFAGAVEYKMKWEAEIDRCRKFGLPIPDPLPHPDDIFVDARSCKVKFAGPMTKQEKAWFDQTVTLMRVMQVQVSTCAAAAKRARSKQRRAELLEELHFYRQKFDEMNDAVAPRYKIELQDRSHHPAASRSGEFAKKMGITLPGPPTPMKIPDVLMQMLEGQSNKR